MTLLKTVGEDSGGDSTGCLCLLVEVLNACLRDGQPQVGGTLQHQLVRGRLVMKGTV